jgi:hypothetical protein
VLQALALDQIQRAVLVAVLVASLQAQSFLHPALYIQPLLVRVLRQHSKAFLLTAIIRNWVDI